MDGRGTNRRYERSEQNPPKRNAFLLAGIGDDSRKPFRAPVMSIPTSNNRHPNSKRSSWTNGMNSFRPNGGSKPSFAWPGFENGIRECVLGDCPPLWGNLDVAKSALLGSSSEGRLIDGGLKKSFESNPSFRATWTLSWAGHLGGKLVEQVAERIEKTREPASYSQTLALKPNTGSTLCSWIRPEWEGEIGIHHGSIERKTRREIEDRLAGTIKAVVCTSSLDLGVDFSPVDQVIQIGGPKGIARLLQRAGRCGHQPGALSKVICVPTQAMELIEFAAARDAMRKMTIESRTFRAPLDLLAQHLVTLALGEGFSSRTGFDEIRSAWSYRDLSKEEWGWVLDFITKGGKSL